MNNLFIDPRTDEPRREVLNVAYGVAVLIILGLCVVMVGIALNGAPSSFGIYN